MKRLVSLTLAMILTCSMLMIGASAATGNSKTFTMENGDSFTISNYVAEVTQSVKFYTPLYETEPEPITYYIVNKDTTITFNVKNEDVDGSITQYAPHSVDGTEYWDPNNTSIGTDENDVYSWDTTLKASDFVNKKQPLAEIRIASGDVWIDDNWEIQDTYNSAQAYIRYDDGTAPKGITATPTASKVLVNGKEISFDAYTINQNNYFKLRDIASVLSGTNKQFEVTWNNEKGAIEMLSNQAYTPVGGELAAGDGLSKTPVLNTAKVYLDGQEVNLTAYTINGNNYFKLRDIGQLFNFGVNWNGAVVVDTSIGYTVD